MVWPFSGRRDASQPKPQKSAGGMEAKPLEPADRKVLSDLMDWFEAEHPGYVARLDQAAVRVDARGGDKQQQPVLVARARKGKLVRLEVREDTPRSLVDALVKAFEKKGQWSFNGVVRTLED